MWLDCYNLRTIGRRRRRRRLRKSGLGTLLDGRGSTRELSESPRRRRGGQPNEGEGQTAGRDGAEGPGTICGREGDRAAGGVGACVDGGRTDGRTLGAGL